MKTPGQLLAIELLLLSVCLNAGAPVIQDPLSTVPSAQPATQEKTAELDPKDRYLEPVIEGQEGFKAGVLQDYERTVKQISSVTGLFENEITEKYSKIDLKCILRTFASSRAINDKTFRVYLSEIEKDGFIKKKQVSNTSIESIERQYYLLCEKIIRVKIEKSKTQVKPDEELGARLLSAVSDGYRLNTVTNPVEINKKHIVTECFEKGFSIEDSVLITVIAFKTGRSVKEVAAKRIKGYDWETLVGAFVPDAVNFICDEGKYWSTSGLKGSKFYVIPNKGRYGSFVQNVDLLGFFTLADKINKQLASGEAPKQEKGSVVDLIVTNFKMPKEKAEKYIMLAGNPDDAIRACVINKKIGKSIEYLIKDRKRFASDDDFYKNYLFLDDRTIKSIEKMYYDITYIPEPEEPEEEPVKQPSKIPQKKP